jgi:Fe-S-cluster containining protein
MTSPTIILSRAYAAREGAPIIDRVDPGIFTTLYFRHCMDCTTCGDSCCQYGADIEINRIHAIEAIADDLEADLGVPRDWWFRTEPEDVGILADADYPGGHYTRTGIQELPAGRGIYSGDACVFLDPAGRGCRLHRFALARGIDVHTIKPMVCIVFPIYFTQGMLHPAIEFEHQDLVCAGTGESIYRGVRDDLAYYFGDAFVAELDAIERAVAPQAATALPMVRP